MTIEISLCGFLFLFILVLNIAMAAFGNKVEIDGINSATKLQIINENPNKFKIGIGLGLIEHLSIIALAILLFVVFSHYNIMLGIVWTVFRIGEGLIFVYNETKYWELLKIAKQYSVTSGAEKNRLSDLGHIILKSKNSRYNFAIILFSIGTLAYSILFVAYGVVPPFIGWLGIVTGISLGFSSGILLVKPTLKALSAFGLVAILFEVLIGGQLLFFGIINP